MQNSQKQHTGSFAIKKNIIVFDLDGTLIQSDQFADLKDHDFTISYYWDDQPAPGGVRVKLRPGVHQLLNRLAEEYHLTLFSHSFPHYIYIEEVLSGGGLKKYFPHVFNNHDEINDKKNLRTVLERLHYNPERDLDKIIIIDDNQWCLQRENLLLIETYYGGSDTLFDEQLYRRIENHFD